MSRIPCNVNKDLLPLYVDDVCSEGEQGAGGGAPVRV